MSLFRHLGLIIWKNLLLRKRQWVVTFFEVFFSILIALIFVGCVKIFFPPDNQQPGSKFRPAPPFDEIPEEKLRWDDLCFPKLSSTPTPLTHNFIAYTPDNFDTKRVMEQLVLEICNQNLSSSTPMALALEPVLDESLLETRYSNEKWWGNSKFRGAVVFPDELKTPPSSATEIKYKIRMNPSYFVSTSKLLPQRYEPDVLRVGPNRHNEEKYKKSGFLGLQWYLDKVIVKEVTGKSALSHELVLQPLPYPTLRHLEVFPGQTLYCGLAMLLIYIVTAWCTCFLIPSLTRNLVDEKQTGIAELLRLTGVPGWLQWVGWSLHVVLPQLITIFLLMLIICYLNFYPKGSTILHKGDPSFLLAILFLHVLSSVSMGFLVCAIFQKPTIATAVGVLACLGSFLAGTIYMRTPDLFPTRGLRLALSLFPNFALAQLWMNIVKWDYMAADESELAYGARWSVLTTDEPINQVNGVDLVEFDKYSVETLYLLLLIMADAILYMVVAVYLDGVLPTEHGVSRPWYFFKCERGWRWGQKSDVSQPPPSEEAPPEIEGTAETTAIEGSMPSEAQLDTTNQDKQTVSGSPAGNEAEVAPGSNEQETMFFSSFEPEPMEVEVGVDIQNIFKTFGHAKIAVNGVSLRMYTGDIFALLGHNGAGKTTLISILTGFFSPTSGTAFINGYDIKTDLDNARKSLGLCPQHNMLFDKLTCGEQLMLFGMLRGLKRQQAQGEMKYLMFRMNIADKEDVLASKLSGGQKRKLSLAIALIGGTKVVVLDEPTSGMDPQARREIWDLLLQLRGERTILLTTHFMEEADVLGDRIGIMASGQLQCCGTSTFLKKFYGTGYTLKLTLHGNAWDRTAISQKNEVSIVPTQENVMADQVEEEIPAFKPSPEAEAVLIAVQKHVPNASFKTDARVDFSNNEVFLCLPTETATTSALSQLFVDLTAMKDKLGIKTIGLSQTTMDEVFVKVGEIGHPQQDISGEEEFIEKAPKGKNPFVGQFLSLLLKMMIYSWRKWLILLFQIVVPFVIFAVAIHLSNNAAKPKIRSGRSGGFGQSQRSGSVSSRTTSTQPSPPAQDQLLITLDVYKSPITVYSGSAYIANVAGSSAKPVGDVTAELVRIGDADRVSYKRRHIVAFEDQGSKVRAMFNLYPYHSAPLAINLASNIILKASGKNVVIKAINHPFYGEFTKPDPTPESPNSNFVLRTGEEKSAVQSRANIFGDETYYDEKYLQKSYFSNKADDIPGIVASIIPLGFILLVANFVIQPIEEKLCKVKQLQTMTGVSPIVYWGTSFTYDFGVVYLLIVFVMFLYLLFADLAIGYKVFTPNGGWFVFIILTMAYGYSAILFCYLVSLRASSVTGGYSLVMLLQLFVAYLGFLPDTLRASTNDPMSAIYSFFFYTFKLFGRCFPSYSFLRGLWYYAKVSAVNGNCRLLAVDTSLCPEPLPYWIWSRKVILLSFGIPPTPEEYNIPGLLQEIFFLFFVGTLYLAWLMLVEYKVCQKTTRQLMADTGFVPNMFDEDVWMEAERVNMLVAAGQTETECVLVQDLSKNYGSFVAVGNLHFGVHYGECFGLLGVNGAGKTTAFRMLTGDEVPSKGNAYGFGTTLENDPNKFYGQIGYCPQFDAIMGHFTGTEMLQLFAGLRGVPFRMRKYEALRWLSRMGLLESANVKCGRYSGGMKRRLSTAMAMIGDPNLILLDEPTSGVDPVSRRQFWSILDKLRQSGQSIILTSHSMEECEALCSRLGIMVNGQFQCFGGVQHLKSKFAQGYSLTVRLKSGLAYGSEEIKANIIDFEVKVQERFQPCELKDKHQNLMQFHLKNPSITWDVLFKTMEEVKTEFESLIEDYSVNETSLEEVFLALARMQYPERRPEASLCKQICSCRC